MNTRQEIIKAVEREIIGPAPNPAYRDENTGEELLLARVHGTPKTRYGGAMLYPQLTENPGETDDEQSVAAVNQEDLPPDEIIGGRTDSLAGGETDEEPVGLANQFLPSALGMTIRAKAARQKEMIEICVTSACYRRGDSHRNVLRVNPEGGIPLPVSRPGGDAVDSDYWVRQPFMIEPVQFDLSAESQSKILLDQVLVRDGDSPWLGLKIYDRTTTADIKEGCRTLTFIIINCKTAQPDQFILYQNKLSVRAARPGVILPYRERMSATDTHEENQLKLLYRKKRIFGIGHGTAVSWNGNEDVVCIETSAIPVFEMPQVAPSGNVELSMFGLSDKGDWQHGLFALENLLRQYSDWIISIETEAANLPDEYRNAAQDNGKKCRECSGRIAEGIRLLKNSDEHSDIVRCFRWMNRAMIWQQQRSKTRQRLWHRRTVRGNAVWELEDIGNGSGSTFKTLEEFYGQSEYNGRWRPFQLAFILMNLKSVTDPSCNERDIVDLIWFPTGGGKTEAYLGLTAFTIFYRRMRGNAEFDWSQYGGTSILMRYTLRLLTTQQYERAASLICACELIRREEPGLGTEEISIGLWVGGSSTPNFHNTGDASAVRQFNDLKSSGGASYNFIIMKCPCCGAQIGKLSQGTATPQVRIKGITKLDGAEGRVVFKCENQECEFSGRELPLYVVDDYIYQISPTLILGTVDKFAMIPWKEKAAHLFGFRSEHGIWSRIAPPDMIIQDELHLISGPLGTMVGLYEIMIQTLCTNFSADNAPFLPDSLSAGKGPKIIASSATISRAAEQVRALYGKEHLHIFPPQGLEFGNTWFSKEMPVTDRHPARIYAGTLGSGYPSIQSAIIRSYAAVLQRIKELADQPDIDYYWTLLAYFNSIRELGNASSLVHADIRERLNQLQNRELVPFGTRRRLYRAKELTSRISAAEIPEALKDLERSYHPAQHSAIDICLATNMVATGVDISRLGLMFIHGQPKTTAEYIQASSRVGRDVPKGPGLIFTIYSPSKPRDKSLYENFSGYHRRIYAYVEPTSVTPFSVNARARALHAVVIGMIRHFSERQLHLNAGTQLTDFTELAEKVKAIIMRRCETADPHEAEDTAKLIDDIIVFWKDRFQYYGDAGNFKILQDDSFFPLMYATSAEIREEIRNTSLPTPTSMRGVDSESHITIAF